MNPLTSQDIVERAAALREIRRRQAAQFFWVALALSAVFVFGFPGERAHWGSMIIVWFLGAATYIGYANWERNS